MREFRQFLPLCSCQSEDDVSPALSPSLTRPQPDQIVWPGNPFTYDEMKSKAAEKGGAVISVTSASVVYSNNGNTAEVRFATNKGSITIPGSEFKTIFNLRAPGYISIKSPLFNIESK